MSLGKIILLLIVMYYVVKHAVENGMEEYFSEKEYKKLETKEIENQ